MPHPSKSGFIVVECQIAPKENNKHVCVPKTWVKCDLLDNQVAIAYPREDESRIATRIKNNEPADDSWQLYIGDIKYEAESYEAAIVGFLTIRAENNKQTEEKIHKTEPVVEPKDSLKLRIVVPKPKPKSEKKKKSFKKHLKEHSKHKSYKSKHKNGEKQSLKENIPDRKNVAEENNSSDSAGTSVTTAIRASGVQKSNSQSSVESLPKSVDSGIDDIMSGPTPLSCLKQVNVNNNNSDTAMRSFLESLDVDIEREIDSSNFSPKDKLLMKYIQTEQREMVQYIKDVALQLKTFHLKVQNNRKTLHEIVLQYKDVPPPVPVETVNQQNANVSEEEIAQDDEVESDDEEIEETEQHNTTVEEAENLLEEQDFESLSESDNHLFTDEESSLDSLPPSSPDVVKKKKKEISKTNTTWTLKHPHMAKDLVHLGGQNTRVFISAKGLEKAKQTCNSVRMFTRVLFKEVFTPEALKTCSMTGRRPYVGKQDVIRPPLHCHARTVILAYAMSYGRQVGWEPIKLSALVQSVRCMLQNSRRVRSKKVKKTMSPLIY